MKTITRIAALVTLVLLIAFAVRATLQLNEANAAIAALAPQRGQLRDAAARMESRLQLAREALLKLEENSAAAATESGRALPGSTGAAAGSDAPAKPARQLRPATLIANDPQKMAEYAEHFRASVGWTYGGMFKALRLSPDQIEKFKDVEVWLREAEMDLEAAADTQRLSRDSAEYRKLYWEYDQSRAPKKREVLGDLADKYFEYYHTLNPRSVAQELAWTGVFTGEPVTAAQVERTADVLIANSQRRGPNLPGVMPSTVDWATARTQLGGILSPTQTEMLGQLVEQDKALRKYYYEGSRLSVQFKSQTATK